MKSDTSEMKEEMIKNNKLPKPGEGPN